jgi:hypothetical protein
VRKASKMFGGPSVILLTTYLGEIGYRGLFLGTLKLNWDVSWLLWLGIRGPKGKP